MDNASIHKTETNADDHPSYNTIFTIPYSPQTNEPAENFFGASKSYLQDIWHETIGMKPADVLFWVKKQIEKYIIEKFTLERSTKYLEHVVEVWKHCKKLIPLPDTFDFPKCEGGLIIRNINTKREE